jgi:hypothetical protein
MWCNRDLQVEEDKFVDVSIASPFERAPVIEAAEETLPSKGFIWLVQPNSDSIVDKTSEEFQLGFVAWEKASDFEESDVQAGVVNCRACSHRASAFLAPKGVSKLKYIIFHDFQKRGQYKVDGHRAGQFMSIVGEPASENVDAVVCIDIGIHSNGVDGEKLCSFWEAVWEGGV